MDWRDPDAKQTDASDYDWREHRCTWGDCLAESLLLVGLFVCFVLASILS